MTIDVSKLKAGDRVILEPYPESIYTISSASPFAYRKNGKLDYEIHYTNGFFDLYDDEGKSKGYSIVKVL